VRERGSQDLDEGGFLVFMCIDRCLEKAVMMVGFLDYFLWSDVRCGGISG